MQYHGGKHHIAKDISSIIQFYAAGGTLVSLFCGVCSVENRCTGFDRLILNDINPYLIAMLRAVQGGWTPPSAVTEDQWRYIRDHKDEDMALAGFVGFGCSFGGKFFGGYARDHQSGRNYAATSGRSLMRGMTGLMDSARCEFTCMDYREVPLPPGCVIYADPPYAGTTKISGRDFDSTAFWNFARRTSEDHLMFISEQSAPEDFVPVWQKGIRRTLDVNIENKFTATEKLFVHKSRYQNLMKRS